MPNGFRPLQEIAYMKEHGVDRSHIAKMPCRIHGIKPGVLQRMAQNGIIKRKSRSNDGTLWQAGAKYDMIMGAWK